MVNAGRILLLSTIIGAGLLGFGILQLNVDLSAIGFTLAVVTGTNATLPIPLIDESSPVLLRTLDFVFFNDPPNTITESSPSFAVAERFASIQNATVITEFTMKLATEDPNVTVTGYVWRTDSPLRLVSSAETFNGTEIGTVLRDVKFTFPRAVVLEPSPEFICPDSIPEFPIFCGQPIINNYAVGIRVDQNLAGSFTYGFINVDTYPDDVFEPIPPDAHRRVVDLHVGFGDRDLDSEFSFTFTPLDQFQRITPACEQIPKPFECQEGMIGIEIWHDQALAQNIEEQVDEIIDQIMNQTDIVTPEEELIACIAIFPPPPECTNEVKLDLMECGIAEELVNGICLCKEGFTRQFVPLQIPLLSPLQQGTFECFLIDVELIPPPLQIQPRVDPIVFLGAGGAILVGSLIGIGVRTFRK